MKTRLRDFSECFFISLKIFLGIAIVGALIGGGICISRGKFDYTLLIEWIYRINIYVGCFGLFIVGLGVLKPSSMEDLSHIETWRTYFSKFGFIKVVAYLSLLITFYGLSIQYILDFRIRI